MQTLRDFKAKQCLLIIEQQRRTRQAHRDELDLAYAASRDPRPHTLAAYDEIRYQLAVEHKHRGMS